MSWTLLTPDAAGSHIPCTLQKGSQIFLVPSGRSITVSLAAGDHDVLGVFSTESWGVSLEAVGDRLRILPGSTSSDPQTAGYMLNSRTNNRTNVLLLRSGDRISCPRYESELVCQWKASEILVNSSAVNDIEQPKTAIEETPVADDPAETEDEDEDLNGCAMPTNATQNDQSLRTTPMPSTVVHETPTAHRIGGWTAFGSPTEDLNNNPKSMEKPASPNDAIFSTARSSATEHSSGEDATKPSVAVRVPVKEKESGQNNLTTAKPPTKRASPAVEEQSNKRVKKQEDDSEEQQHVAFSNSAIADKSAAMKFLRKKGMMLEQVKEDCTVLCVRNGALHKTMKLFKAIARGIPIVTDLWLLDSAKAGHFLPKESYIPSIPDQEKEWGFSLGKIWSQSQSSLFEGYTLHFTPSVKATYKEFKEIEEVCKAVGATKVISRKKGPESGDEKTIVLAKEEDDEDASKLAQDGRPCYSKDLLTNSILRGQVDLESDEFKIRPSSSTPTQAAPSAKGKKGRPRKS